MFLWEQQSNVEAEEVSILSCFTNTVPVAEGQQCWCLSWHLVEDLQEDRKPLSGTCLCASSSGRGRWSIWILGQPIAVMSVSRSQGACTAFFSKSGRATSPSCNFGCISFGWEDLLIKIELVPLLFFHLMIFGSFNFFLFFSWFKDYLHLLIKDGGNILKD